MVENLDIPHIFIFLLPGFITVWSFRYFTRQRKEGEFEYALLSIFWGLVILMFYEFLSNKEQIDQTLNNVYAAGAFLLTIGFLFGGIGSVIVRHKDVIKWLKKLWSKNKKCNKCTGF